MRRWVRRRVVGWVTAGLGGTLLAACARPGGDAGDRDQLSRQPAHSVPLLLWARGVSDKAVFDQITPLVEGRYPYLAVTCEAVTGINDKIVVGLAGGNGADLAVDNMPFGVPMMGQNAFVRLQPYLARDRETEAELKSFAPPGLRAYRYRNEPYAIPITSESIVFWYNEYLLRQAGLTPPHELSEPLDRLMPQIFDNALAVHPGLQDIEQQTNTKLEPAVRAAGQQRP